MASAYSFDPPLREQATRGGSVLLAFKGDFEGRLHRENCVTAVLLAPGGQIGQ